MRKGTYQLLLRLHRDQTIQVGKLGTFRFPAGYYVYTGSAMGGREARIARHLSKTKRFHWHIDYLLEHCSIVRYAIRESPNKRECEFNAAIPSSPKVFRFRERVADIPITRLLSLGCVPDPNYRPHDRAVACDIPGIDVH